MGKKTQETTQIKVDIPQNLIDEAAGRELLAAKRMIVRQEAKIRELEQREAKNRALVDRAKALHDYVTSAGFEIYYDDM
jgi:hypothetical protein